MRHSEVCPKCDGRRFAVQPQLRIPQFGTANRSNPIPAVTTQVPGEPFDDRETHGFLTLWSCLGCGHSELYARLDPEHVAALARQHPEQVTIVDRTPPTGGPHR